VEGSLRQCHPGADASGGDALAAIAIAYLYDALWGWRLLDIELNLWSLLLLFLLQDLCYWLFHFASHHVRWLWASHVVHHSSERLNLSTAFRQSLMYPVSGMWLFWIPMILIGFPRGGGGHRALEPGFSVLRPHPGGGQARQTGVDLQHPSHHRVHHASNARYIDRNFAGVLIIWDRLFGTFVEEDLGEPCRFGITKPIHSFNPLTLTFHEWRDMLQEARGLAAKARRAVWQTGGPHQRLTHRPG
jgi:sterol desaturase/sphingolipid hydroxylase (fatty acid hydroxylase superfamily)